MTNARTFLFAACALLTVGLILPASAGTLVAAKSGQDAGVVVGDEIAGLHAITDRGSWVAPRSHFKRDYGRDHRYGHYKKKGRKHYKRGYRRGYREGYNDGRYRSHFGYRRHHHRHYGHYYPDRGFRGGIYFGDGYGSGGGFRLRF